MKSVKSTGIRRNSFSKQMCRQLVSGSITSSSFDLLPGERSDRRQIFQSRELPGFERSKAIERLKLAAACVSDWNELLSYRVDT